MDQPKLSTAGKVGNGHSEPEGFELPPLGEISPPGHGAADVPDDLDGRIVIRLEEGRFRDITDQIIDIALAAELPIYRHGPYLCRPKLHQRKLKDGSKVTVGVLRNHTVDTLRHLLEQEICFLKFNSRKRWVKAVAPEQLMNRLLDDASERSFRPIRGLLQTPIVGPDLKLLLTKEGYDEATGYYVIDPPALPDLDLSEAGARRALGRLQDLLSEFPFDGPRSLSVALSGLLTPLVRAACDVVPGHLYNAPSQGSGKSLLVDLAAAIATGDAAYAVLAHRNPEETDKQLTGAVIEGRQIIPLDNVMGELSSPLLAQVMERPNIMARPLGTSTQISIVNAFCVYITGINVRLAGDNTRRVLVCRIQAQHENPIDRSFEKEHPLLRVAAARGEFIAACLTIVLAYQQACAEADERPVRVNPLPSYGDWSALVREPLMWLGLPDPVESIRASFQDDPSVLALGAVLAALAAAPLVNPWTVNGAVHVADTNPDLFDAFVDVASNGKGGIDATKLGLYLRSVRDRPVDGRCIHAQPKPDRTGKTLWELNHV